MASVSEQAPASTSFCPICHHQPLSVCARLSVSAWTVDVAMSRLVADRCSIRSSEPRNGTSNYRAIIILGRRDKQTKRGGGASGRGSPTHTHTRPNRQQPENQEIQTELAISYLSLRWSIDGATQSIDRRFLPTRLASSSQPPPPVQSPVHPQSMANRPKRRAEGSAADAQRATSDFARGEHTR